MSDSKVIRNSSGLLNKDITFIDVRKELFRKAIHMMVALIPLAASVNLLATKVFLIAALFVYSLCEIIRLHGRKIVLVSSVTMFASRGRDNGHFVMGPIALTFGALMALMLYPSNAAAIGVYALAFGDSAASIVGRFWGRIQFHGIGKKTLEGSLACFIVVFVLSYIIVQDTHTAFLIAAVATATELVPLKDLDNILIPTVVGAVSALLL